MSSSIIANNLYSYMDESGIHPLLKCNICSKPFVDPVSTQNGDRFCRSCISQILRRDLSNESGITNEQQLSKMQTLTPVTEGLVLEMLNSLPVRCTKCGEENIMRGQLDEHENQACIQATVLCPAADLKCTWMGARTDLDEHVQECQFEPLRSALEGIFNEHDQLKERIENLSTEIDGLLNIDIEL